MPAGATRALRARPPACPRTGLTEGCYEVDARARIHTQADDLCTTILFLSGELLLSPRRLAITQPYLEAWARHLRGQGWAGDGDHGLCRPETFLFSIGIFALNNTFSIRAGLRLSCKHGDNAFLRYIGWLVGWLDTFSAP